MADSDKSDRDGRPKRDHPLRRQNNVIAGGTVLLVLFVVLGFLGIRGLRNATQTVTRLTTVVRTKTLTKTDTITVTTPGKTVTTPGETVTTPGTTVTVPAAPKKKSSAAASTAPLGSGPWTYLSNEQSVGDNNAAGGAWNTNAAATVGTDFSHTVEMVAYCGNQDGGTMWVDYHLGKQFTEFASSVGLRSDAETSTKFTFRVIATYNSKDVRTLWSGSMLANGAKSKAFSVKGVIRLRLLIIDPSSITQDCSTTYFFVWGNPRVR